MGAEEFECIGASLEEDLIESFCDLRFLACEHLEGTKQGRGIDRVEGQGGAFRSAFPGCGGLIHPALIGRPTMPETNSLLSRLIRLSSMT